MASIHAWHFLLFFWSSFWDIIIISVFLRPRYASLLLKKKELRKRSCSFSHESARHGFTAPSVTMASDASPQMGKNYDINICRSTRQIISYFTYSCTCLMHNMSCQMHPASVMVLPWPKSSVWCKSPALYWQWPFRMLFLIKLYLCLPYFQWSTMVSWSLVLQDQAERWYQQNIKGMFIP